MISATLLVAACILPARSFARPDKFVLVDKGGRGKKSWKLYRGNRIKNVKDLRWLKKKGITRVVALENWNHKSLMRAAKRMGIEYLPRFMSRGRPGELGRKRFGENVTDDLIKPGENTYVYCTYGVHRTGGTVGRYRAEQGWGCKRILAEMHKHGFRNRDYKKYGQLVRWVKKRCRKNRGDEKARSDEGQKKRNERNEKK
jgi:hypothetical protein